MPELRIKAGRLSSAVLILFLILTAGCAGLKETARGVIGISTREIENSRKDALKKEFGFDYTTCYNKTLETLGEMGSYVYARDQKKKLIAIYVSDQDTTSVGIFLTPIDARRTQVEVSSPSTYAKEYIAKYLFSGLLGQPFKKQLDEKDKEKG